jgi:hypothetical protein
VLLDWLAWLERTGLSIWVRESPSLLAFPFILFLHTLGLAMLAGLSVGIDAWLITTRRAVPRHVLAGVQRIMWLGFGINALSGAVLLLAYPAKALTNWVFFAKLLFVGLAVWTVELINRDLDVSAAAEGTASARARRLAWTSLLWWAGAILTGRLLAYTHSILLVSEGFF